MYSIGWLSMRGGTGQRIDEDRARVRVFAAKKAVQNDSSEVLHVNTSKSSQNTRITAREACTELYLSCYRRLPHLETSARNEVCSSLARPMCGSASQ